MIQTLLILPFAVQGLAMFFDEFYFHHRRGLGPWEIVGHPLDSLSVFICYWFLTQSTYNEANLLVYIGLTVFSCALVTKDEFVHTELCEARENWLHALLFVLHPICFLSAGFMWALKLNLDFILIQSYVVLGFMFYKIIYWGLKWKKRSL